MPWWFPTSQVCFKFQLSPRLPLESQLQAELSNFDGANLDANWLHLLHPLGSTTEMSWFSWAWHSLAIWGTTFFQAQPRWWWCWTKNVVSWLDHAVGADGPYFPSIPTIPAVFQMLIGRVWVTDRIIEQKRIEFYRAVAVSAFSTIPFSPKGLTTKQNMMFLNFNRLTFGHFQSFSIVLSVTLRVSIIHVAPVFWVLPAKFPQNSIVSDSWYLFLNKELLLKFLQRPLRKTKERRC